MSVMQGKAKRLLSPRKKPKCRSKEKDEINIDYGRRARDCPWSPGEGYWSWILKGETDLNR